MEYIIVFLLFIIIIMAFCLNKNKENFSNLSLNMPNNDSVTGLSEISGVSDSMIDNNYASIRLGPEHFKHVTLDWLNKYDKISKKYLKYYYANNLKSPYFVVAPQQKSFNLNVGFLMPQRPLKLKKGGILDFRNHTLQLFQRQDIQFYDKFYYYVVLKVNNNTKIIPLNDIYINGVRTDAIARGTQELFDGDIIYGISGFGKIPFKVVRTIGYVIPQ